MKIILLLLLLVCLNATERTVCASGCTTTSVQTALNASAGGDIVTITAGETFEGAFTLPFRTESGQILVRSSRWAELPPVGTRVVAANSNLMPKLMATNTSEAILTAGFTKRTGSSVNTATDVITFSATLNIPENTPFVCRYSVGGSGPVTAYTIYYARDVSGATLKVAATPGGTALDLTTTITGTMSCMNNTSIRGWKFQGIEFAGKPGSPSQNSLVHMSSDANDRAGLTSDIQLDRVYIHGIRDEDGARNCLVMNARTFSLTDSRLEFCKLLGVESHAISMVQAPGPGLIRNNYLDGASENILFGGDFKNIPNIVNGDEGGIEIVGNHIFKPLYLKYLAGDGQANVPVQSCAGGSIYSLDTSTGLVYKCKTANTWTLNPTCADDEYFRQTNASAQTCVGGACWKCASGVYVPDTVYRSGSYFVKNSYECKNCINIHFHGNVVENNWTGNGDQSGVGIWVISQNDNGNGNEWVRGENLNFHDNILKNSELGFRVTTNGSNVYGLPNKQVHVKNNIGIGIGGTDYPSIPDQNATGNGSGLQPGGRCEDCSWDHNTIYPGSTTNGNGWQFDTSAVTRLFFGNNIGGRGLYGVRGDSGSDCTGITTAPGVINADDLLINNALVDNQANGGLGSIGSCATNTRYVSGPWSTHVTSATDLRLKVTSPYSASNGSATYIGTDGKDLGADIDSVEAHTNGTVSGVPSMQSTIKIIPGSTRTSVKYTAPTASACNLKLYDNIGRVTLHADTADSAKWVDTRTGNVNNGEARQFVLGTISALTASTKYWGVISCGSTIGVLEFSTTAVGSTYNAKVKYSSAIAGEYSTDLSSWTPITLAQVHTVPVSGVTYYRRIGGEIAVLIAKN